MLTVRPLQFESGPESHFDNRSTAYESKCPFNRLIQKFKLQSMRQIEKSANCPSILSICNWIRNFIAKPNPEVGRQGAVCPFIARALNSDSIFFKKISFTGFSIEQLDELIKDQAEVFLQTEPNQGKARLNKAIVMVFEDLPQPMAQDMIEETQRRLKPFFVERGMMLGEFHQHHQGEGIHNKNFRPLQSAVPLLIIRHLVPPDLIFLNRKTDSAARRIHFLNSYISMHQDQLSPALKSAAIASLEEAIHELAAAGRCSVC